MSQSITVSPDTTICLGGSAALHAEVVGGGGYGTGSYSFMTIPFDTMPFNGGIPLDTAFHASQCTASGHDDCWGGPFDIGFSFCFLNAIYDQFYVGSNGWISFSKPSNTWNNYVPDTLPNPAGNAPKNCIMTPWQDWNPGAGGAGNNIYYYTTGTAPDRKCVVYWKNCPMYSCTSIKGNFQIVIHEQNSAIENNIVNKDSCSWKGNKATQGVQNLAGTVAFIHPGRNNKSWKAYDESTAFVPDSITWYTGGFPGGTPVGYGANITFSPTVTTTYTGVVQVCGGAFSSDDVTVTVMDPRFSYSSSFYCKDQPNPVPSLNMAAGTFSASPAGLVFVSAVSGEIDIAASAPGTYTVTHTISSPCTVSDSRPVTIYALPAAPMAVTPFVERCGPGNVTFSVSTGLHQGVRWYNTPTGGTLLPLSGLTVTTAIAATTLFYAEAYDTTSTCHSSTRTLITATVKPIPNITNPVLRDTICSGFNNLINLTADQPGTNFSWTASVTIGNVTGYTTPGSGSTISDNLTNNLMTNGEVCYIVSPAVNGCTGPAVSFRTTVKPKPSLIITPPAGTVCSGQTTDIALTSGVAGAAFSWTASGSSGNVSGYSASAGNAIAQTLNNTGISVESVTYTVTPSANGCTGTQGNVVVTVNPVPVVSLSSCWDSPLTTNTQPLLLKGGLPPGGTYSGTGVSAGYFNPAVSGAGTFPVTYSYTNMFTCARTATKPVTVISEQPFSCGDNFTDPRDNTIYPTVQISTLCWMAANLNYGTTIGSGMMQRDNCTAEKYCYNDNPANCGTRGGLYMWDEMMGYTATGGSRGLCPPGWRLPTESDWNDVFVYYISNGFAGAPLRYDGYSGFNALLSGVRFENVRWSFDGFAVLFWTSTQHAPGKAWAHGINSYTTSASYYPGLKSNAFPVRCVR